MMKHTRLAIRSFSGLLFAGAVLFQADILSAQSIPIAVMEFEGNGISQTEAIALTDRLRNELFRLGTFEVVERGMMETILTEQDFQLTGCTSNECLVEVGQLLGARQVVGGRISRVGAMFTVSARVVDVQTGKLLGVSDFDLRGGLEEMLTRGMGEVAAMLSGDKQLPTETAFQRMPDQAVVKEPRDIIEKTSGFFRPPYTYRGGALNVEEAENLILSIKDVEATQLIEIYRKRFKADMSVFLLIYLASGILTTWQVISFFDKEVEPNVPILLVGVGGVVACLARMRQTTDIFEKAVDRYNEIVKGNISQ